ncbi:alpha-L-rhamnosidase A [Pyrenophora tritici-repentis]|nr:alpha-L-rhamnosidase A [Pyrenophora tritici-repentis]
MTARPCCLRTNRLLRPLGIDAFPVEFSWQLTAKEDACNITQSFYELQVSTSLSFESEAIVWDSGKIATSKKPSLTAIYAGDSVKSRTRYYWRLRVWDQFEETSDDTWDTAEQAWFETGLLQPSDWKASWIGAPAMKTTEISAKDDRVIYLSRNLQLAQTPVRVRAYATACGWYKLFVNEHNVTGTALVPRWTPFDQFTEYQTYDIADYLKTGENVISVVVADGRFKGQIGATEGRCRYGDRLSALVQLEVNTDDGSTVTFCTDETWRSVKGPIVRSDPVWGEHTDFRISVEWLGKCDTLSSNLAEKVTVLTKKLIAEEVERVEEVMRLSPKDVLRAPSGVQIVDFGQNFAGIMAIKLRGRAGSKVTMTYSEVLSSNGELNIDYLKLPVLPHIVQRDVVTLGDDAAEFQPWFTIHGFRYAEVQGLDYDLSPSDIQGIVLASNFPNTGSFTCSDARLNKLYQNIVWGARSNFTDIPTDCPTRERMGWTGDIQVFSPTATLLFDSQNFLRRFLRCVAAEQNADGTINPYIPSGESEFSNGQVSLMSKMMRITSGSTGWGDASTMVPWTLYMYYNDEVVLSRQYDSMKRWVNSLAGRARDKMSWGRWLFNKFGAGCGDLEHYIVDTGFSYGEWLRAGSGFLTLVKEVLFPSAAVSTAYLANSSRLLSNIAKILGKQDDADHYLALSQKTSEAWRSAFVRRGGSRIAGDFQDDYVRALAFNLVEPEQKPAALERLVELITQAGYHLQTGFMSTGLLLPTLAEHGRSDIAYRLLMQDTVPSWLYPVSKGATTLWETWEGYDGKGNAKMSHNHYAFGSVAQWLHERVAGMKAVEPGYRKIRVEPLIGGGLTHAEASLKTPLGFAKSSWSLNRETGMVRLEIVIPPCATAEVVLAGSKIETIESGQHSFQYKLD